MNWQKPEGTQVIAQVHQNLKVPKWLEMRLDKGMWGPDCEAPGMLGQQVLVCIHGLYHRGFKAGDHCVKVCLQEDNSGYCVKHGLWVKSVKQLWQSSR